MISRDRESVFSNLKIELLFEFITKIEKILTHDSVAQAGLKYEKNWRSKISLDSPFKTLFYVAPECIYDA